MTDKFVVLKGSILVVEITLTSRNDPNDEILLLHYYVVFDLVYKGIPFFNHQGKRKLVRKIKS